MVEYSVIFFIEQGWHCPCLIQVTVSCPNDKTAPSTFSSFVDPEQQLAITSNKDLFEPEYPDNGRSELVLQNQSLVVWVSHTVCCIMYKKGLFKELWLCGYFLEKQHSNLLVKLYLLSSGQEGYIEELTSLSQCLIAKTGFVHFWSVYQSFLYWIFMFQIVHFQKILEVQCLNSIRLTAPLYILLGLNQLCSYTLYLGLKQSTLET